MMPLVEFAHNSLRPQWQQGRSTGAQQGKAVGRLYRRARLPGELPAPPLLNAQRLAPRAARPCKTG